MNNELISIIVPCYNVEKYAERCIDSLINQTYSNIEIILVNDGSTDNTLNILKKMKNKDDRIVLIDQANAGLSGARNTGLINSNGNIVSFVDSDDFVDKFFIEKLYINMTINSADISACDYIYIDENNNIWNNVKKKKEKIYSNIEALKDMFTGKQLIEVMTWNKLYKKSLFIDNNIEFPVGKLHEDNFTTYKLFYHSNKISLITDKLYYYLQRSNSIMGKKFNEKRLDILISIDETRKFLIDNNCKSMLKYYETYKILVELNLITNMYRDNYREKKLNELIDDIKDNYKKIMFDFSISIKEKIKIIILLNNKELFQKIINKQ